MAHKPLILFISNNHSLRRLLHVELEKSGFVYLPVYTTAQVHRMVSQLFPDLIMMDAIPDDTHAWDFLRQHVKGSDIPIIVLSPSVSTADEVRAFGYGADDFLSCPFDSNVLIARINAVLRRRFGKAKGEVFRFQSLSIDLFKRRVCKDGQDVALTRTEWRLLEYMVKNSGRVLTNSEVLSHIWGPEYRDEYQYLRVWISRLRNKLEDTPTNPKLIKTFHSVGYRLNTEPDE